MKCFWEEILDIGRKACVERFVDLALLEKKLRGFLLERHDFVSTHVANAFLCTGTESKKYFGILPSAIVL